jgi:hypothetical protein
MIVLMMKVNNDSDDGVEDSIDDSVEDEGWR